MYKKLVCFDFDNTLIYTPLPELGKYEWEKKTGLIWTSKGWWSKPESLDLDVFYPTVNEWVYKYYKEYMEDNESYVFLATGRLKKLEKQVLDVLNLHKITFKPSWDSETGVYCCTGDSTFNFKKNLLEKKINDNPHAEELIIFDDRPNQLENFLEWSKTQSIKITIIDIINKKIL